MLTHLNRRRFGNQLIGQHNQHTNNDANTSSSPRQLLFNCNKTETVATFVVKNYNQSHFIINIINPQRTFRLVATQRCHPLGGHHDAAVGRLQLQRPCIRQQRTVKLAGSRLDFATTEMRFRPIRSQLDRTFRIRIRIVQFAQPQKGQRTIAVQYGVRTVGRTQFDGVRIVQNGNVKVRRTNRCVTLLFHRVDGFAEAGSWRRRR